MNGLPPDEQRLADRLRLTVDDLALLFELQREPHGLNPWFVLGLERGWLTGDVVEPGSYTGQGAILLGIDPDEADDEV